MLRLANRAYRAIMPKACSEKMLLFMLIYWPRGLDTGLIFFFALLCNLTASNDQSIKLYHKKSTWPNAWSTTHTYYMASPKFCPLTAFCWQKWMFYYTPQFNSTANHNICNIFLKMHETHQNNDYLAASFFSFGFVHRPSIFYNIIEGEQNKKHRPWSERA